MRILLLSQWEPPRKVLLATLKQVAREILGEGVEVLQMTYLDVQRSPLKPPPDLVVLDIPGDFSVAMERIADIRECHPRVKSIGFIGCDGVSMRQAREVFLVEHCLMLSPHKVEQSGNNFRRFFEAKLPEVFEGVTISV